MGHPPGTPPYASLADGAPLECVIALGHDDEGDRHPVAAAAGRTPGTVARHRSLVAALTARGYAVGPVAAAPVLAATGREPVPDGCTTFLTHPDAFRPSPSAPGRPVVVRIVANTDGRQGACAAAALSDGLRSATVCMYVGHLRFGLGPDFDPALPITVTPGSGLPADPDRLARHAARTARRSGRRLEETLDSWLSDGLLRIDRTGAGRVVLAHRNLVPGSAVARLTHWLARNAPGGLAEPAFPARSGSGPVVVSADRPDASGARPPRLWVLMTCRASALFPALRRGLAPDPVWLVGPPGMVSLEEWRTLPWILDALAAGGPWAEILGVLDAPAYGGRLVLDAPAGHEDRRGRGDG
ncbi:hypothetical protein [Micromonospora robiginosa]|uniref:Uncharacterized protein n=1 Tax=Micromonospora robiginosa TaxID=2749844 RepID=A0A7L6B3G4_9ACTN|nr:hypothetical protein [Micromonospora ferruginea]QLQ36477.1 hypothetical protein H1D33_24750 [Micromonospora ferruginea]